VFNLDYEREKRGRWVTWPLKCYACSHCWVGVFPEQNHYGYFECPSCHALRGALDIKGMLD
jgi:hypothetical protein